MKVVLAILSLFYISTIISLWLTGVSSADVDLKNANGIWLFDEGTGNQARDSSAKGNHGKLMNGPAWGKGKFSKALEFDGKDDYVVSSSNIGISEDAERTITFWFKPASSDGRQTIVGWGVGESLKMYWVEYNGFQGGPNNIYAGGFDGDAYTLETLPLNQWHHVAVVHSGKISETKIYYNGVSQKIELWGGNPADDKLKTADSPVSIGYDLPLNRQPFKGAIDDVAIFDVVLTETDVKDLMKKGLFQAVLGIFPGGKLATTWGAIKTE